MSTVKRVSSGSLGDVVVVDFERLTFEPTLVSTLRDNAEGYSVHHIDPTVETANLTAPITMTELAASYAVAMKLASVEPIAVVGFCGGTIISGVLQEMAVKLGYEPLDVWVEPSCPTPSSLFADFTDYRRDLGRSAAGLDLGNAGNPDRAQMLSQLKCDLQDYAAEHRMEPASEKMFIEMTLRRYRAWFTYVAMCFDADQAESGPDVTILSQSHAGQGDLGSMVRTPRKFGEMFEDSSVARLLFQAVGAHQASRRRDNS